MQNKPNKLPYVFVEIDENDDSEISVPYGANAEVLPYNSYYPSGVHMGFPQAPDPRMPFLMQHPQAMQPYPRPASPFVPPQFAQRFPASTYPQDDYQDVDEPYVENEDCLDDQDDVIVDRAEEYIDEQDLNYDSEGDYQNDQGEDIAHADESGSNRVGTDIERASDGEMLNLETVVIPVFKKMEKGAPPLEARTYPLPFQQSPMAFSVPQIQPLPYAYNPYRVPFVSPLWMFPRASAPNLSIDPHKANPYNLSPQAHFQAPPRPVAGGQSNASSSPHPKRGSTKAAHIPEIKQAPRQDDYSSVRLPAEAREALSSIDVPLPSSAANDIHASSIGARQAINPPDPVRADHADTASKTQTITASTDSVSVSVSVVPPSNKVEPKPVEQSSAASKYPAQAVSDKQTEAPQSAPQIQVPVSKGSKARKRQAGNKAPKETFEEKAMRENAEKTHTSLDESNDVDQMGKPLLDPNAIATSDMFSTPSASMSENLTGFQFRSSRRKHVLMIVLVVLVIAIVVAAVVCVSAVWTGAATIEYDGANAPSFRFEQQAQTQ